MAKVPEFIETYSDDVSYLIDAREVLLRHPFRTEMKTLCNASFCRMLAVFMIGSIEAMLQHWKERDQKGILEKYFKENASNGERVQSLYEAFKKAGINVDKEIFEDYLAIKYLRNIIVHARWKPHEKEWLKIRGFPTDTRKLSEKHWHRMLEVNQNMMMYIALAGIPELRKRLPKEKMIRIPIKQKEIKRMIITRKDLPDVIYRNLANIASEIYQFIVKAATSKKYGWDREFSTKTLEKLAHRDAKKLFYMAAKRAVEENYEGTLSSRQLMKDAIFFWNLYKQETFAKNRIKLKEIKESLKILMKLHQQKDYFKGPFFWDKKLPIEAKLEIINNCLKGYKGLSKIAIVKSLEIGELTYTFMPDITLVSLFAIYLPIIDPENARKLINEVRFILTAWKLREAWYLFIERHESPNKSEWAFYEELFNELLA